MKPKCAPFTPEEVASINEFQACDIFHPFTCASGSRTDAAHGGGPGKLVARESGMFCPSCDYTQACVHDMMADGSWRAIARSHPFYKEPSP